MLKRYVKKILPSSRLIQRLPGPAANRILLTFDDGPHPEITPRVLDLLNEYDARAIFFIPGRRISKAPHLLPQIIERGHEIGNHIYSHVNGKQPSFSAYLRDIKKCQQALVEYAGAKPRFFRPPQGIISPVTILAPKAAGLRMMIWSRECQDWRLKNRDAAQKAGRNLSQKVQGGDIVLLHDDNQFVVDILQIILPDFVAKGFDMARGIELL